MHIQTTTLENGLRIVTDTVSSVESVALGIWAGVGTRNEMAQTNGVAHMVEHMLFKGTKTRNVSEIAGRIESVGGHVNAYTSREVTSYHAHLLKQDTALAVDVLSDMVMNATLPEDELERERQVILQEIGMVADTPDDVIFDHYQETAYPGQTLGAPILGDGHSVRAMPRSALQTYIDRHYTPANMVVSAAGNIDHDHFVDLVTERMAGLAPGEKTPRGTAVYQGGESRREKPLEQSHIVLGFQGLPRLDDAYYRIVMLSAILGGGMSSRLVQEIREKRGLVYSIYAFHSAYVDDGQFHIYAGTGPDRLPELVPVLCDQLQNLGETLTDEEVERARAQLKAGLLMGRESMTTRADQLAKHMIFFDKALDIAQIVARIDAARKEDICAMAQRLFSQRPTLALLGPLEKMESYEQVCGRLAA